MMMRPAAGRVYCTHPDGELLRQLTDDETEYLGHWSFRRRAGNTVLPQELLSNRPGDSLQPERAFERAISLSYSVVPRGFVSRLLRVKTSGGDDLQMTCR